MGGRAGLHLQWSWRRNEHRRSERIVILPTTVTIHTRMYVKPEIHTADMRNVIMNHFFQKPLLQSGMVRKSRVMMGRDKTQRIRFRSLSGTANTLLCSAGMQVDKHDLYDIIGSNKRGHIMTKMWIYPQESHWGHAGWGTDESILSHPGRSRCLFWSDCGLAGWRHRSSPSEAVSPSSHWILYPDRCSTGSPFSGETHWYEGRSTEPRCRLHKPAADRRHHTCQIWGFRIRGPIKVRHSGSIFRVVFMSEHSVLISFFMVHLSHAAWPVLNSISWSS